MLLDHIWESRVLFPYSVNKCLFGDRGGSAKMWSTMLEKNLVWNGGLKMENLCGIVWTQNGGEICKSGCDLLYKTRMSESLIFLQFRPDFDGVFARGWVLGLGWREKYWRQEIHKGLPWKPETQAFRPYFTKKKQDNFGSLLLWCLWTEGDQTW